MKTILLLSLALALSAFDSITAAKIFDKIFHAMISKENIVVYTVNDAYKEVVISAPRLHLGDRCNDADIILVDDFDEIPKGCSDKVFFSTSYPVFKDTDNAVGAFYWERGHITIKFSKRRLLDRNITLPENFSKYIVEKW